MSEILYQLVVSGEAEVERHPKCPACGREGCETVHTQGEVTQ